MKKLERDGMVAVVNAPGYGAGWSTWNKSRGVELCMDADIAQAVLDGEQDRAGNIAQAKYDPIYDGAVGDLRVKWIPKGAQFVIQEYDGAESVRLMEEVKYMTA